MQVTEYELELYHHGIKGQRWGIRRTDAQLGHPQKPKATFKKNPIENIRKSQEGGSSKPDMQTIVRSGDAKLVAQYSKEMDRAQLIEAMDRIDKEKKLAELTKEPSKIEKGVQALEKINKNGKVVYESLKLAKDTYDIINGFTGKSNGNKPKDKKTDDKPAETSESSSINQNENSSKPSTPVDKALSNINVDRMLSSIDSSLPGSNNSSSIDSRKRIDGMLKYLGEKNYNVSGML